MLESLGFSSVFTADGGEMLKAYAKARRSRKPFDAVILDLTVRSGMGGQEAARRLLELDAGVCALVSSGYANAPILANHAEFGFRAALPKPYTLGALARALEEALG
jgi:CheY-like chemotaxis protein